MDREQYIKPKWWKQHMDSPYGDCRQDMYKIVRSLFSREEKLNFALKAVEPLMHYHIVGYRLYQAVKEYVKCGTPIDMDLQHAICNWKYGLCYEKDNLPSHIRYALLAISDVAGITYCSDAVVDHCAVYAAFYAEKARTMREI